MLVFTFIVFLVVIPITVVLGWDRSRWAVVPAVVWLVWLILLMHFGKEVP